MQPVLERGDDAKVAAAAPEAPEQVGVLVGADGERPPVGGDHVGGNHVVAAEAVAAGQPSNAAAQRKPGDAGVRGRSLPERRVRRPGSRGRTLPTWRPPGPGTVLATGSTRTPVIRKRSIINPSSQTLLPGKLWPPPRTEISRPFSLAKLTELITSAAPLQRAIRAGRLSTMAFQIRSDAVVVLVAGEQRLAVQADPEVLHVRLADDGVIAGQGRKVSSLPYVCPLSAFRRSGASLILMTARSERIRRPVLSAFPVADYMAEAIPTPPELS